MTNELPSPSLPAPAEAPTPVTMPDSSLPPNVAVPTAHNTTFTVDLRSVRAAKARFAHRFGDRGHKATVIIQYTLFVTAVFLLVAGMRNIASVLIALGLMCYMLGT